MTKNKLDKLVNVYLWRGIRDVVLDCGAMGDLATLDRLVFFFSRENIFLHAVGADSSAPLSATPR